jgi:hypothetical protein
MKNSDVYGWLSVINYCLWLNLVQVNEEQKRKIKTFLSKYMYDVDTFTTPYNTDEIINEFKEIINPTS